MVYRITKLPLRFVFAYGDVLARLILNVPFTTVLITHATLLLFLLRHLTPLRAASKPDATARENPQECEAVFRKDHIQIKELKRDYDSTNLLAL